jgi:hypothetical protein
MNDEHPAWFAISIEIGLNLAHHIEEHAGREPLTLRIHRIPDFFAFLSYPLEEILSLLWNDGLGELIEFLIQLL